MREINWQKFDPTDFERITFRLVEAMGFDQPTWVAGPSDRGEDIIAFHPSLYGNVRKRKWVFQSKLTKRPLEKLAVTKELANFIGKGIDTWVLVTTFRPSPEYRRWFEDLEKDPSYSFRIEAWWKDELEKFIDEQSDKLKKSLSEDICNILNITSKELAKYESEYSSIQARCRLQAADQIEQYAKSKYISGLYVDRSLQEDLSKFFASEGGVAEKISQRATDMLQEVRTKLVDFPGRYDKKTEKIAAELNNLEEILKKIEDSDEELENEYRSKKISSEERKVLKGKNANERRENQDLLKRKKGELKARHKSLQKNKKITAFINKIVKTIDKVHTEALPPLGNRYFSSIEKIRQFLQEVKEISFLFERQINRVAPNFLGNKFENNRTNSDKSTLSDDVSETAILLENRFLPTLNDIFLAGVTFIENLLKNTLIFIDRAGSGKTNVICHTVKQMSSQELVLLFFGKETFNGPNGLKEALLQNISQFFKSSTIDALEQLNQLLEEESKFLNVFIDGINENRNLKDFDAALVSYLRFSSHYRIRNIITCRDIYWDFFSVQDIENTSQPTIRDSLNIFSPEEYRSAVPLYLQHYNINCELAEEAKEACHHPLLLRFFCEAHRNVNFEEVFLGNVPDIRLKELFDLYLTKKTEQIRQLLSHRNSDIVNEYLTKLASQIFVSPDIPITTNRLSEITGDTNITLSDSLYVHLLDEDIIIEEKPSDDISIRQVNFVYEEFMEYLIARSILHNPTKFEFLNIQEIFSKLNTMVESWVNARGVGEYIAIMLANVEKNSQFNRDDSIFFFRQMTQNGPTWGKAFWSVISKLPQKIWILDIYDLLYDALRVLPNIEIVEKTLKVIDRHDPKVSQTLAGKIIWTSALPNVLTWKQTEMLGDITEGDLDELCTNLVSIRKRNIPWSYPGKINFYKFLRIITPFLDENSAKQVEKSVRIFGKPDGHSDASSFFIRLFWKAFPENYPYLLNGLFGDDKQLRIFCADKLRFGKFSQAQVAFICKKLSEVEDVKEIRATLISSSKYLNYSAAKLSSD